MAYPSYYLASLPAVIEHEASFRSLHYHTLPSGRLLCAAVLRDGAGTEWEADDRVLVLPDALRGAALSEELVTALELADLPQSPTTLDVVDKIAAVNSNLAFTLTK